MHKIYLIYLILLLTILLIGCSDNIVESVPSIDEDNVAEELAPKFTEIQNNIFNQSCAFSGCHVSGGVNPDLSGNSYENIVNRASSTGMDYVKPNDPDNSYILLKMIGSSGINGSRMPLNSSPIPQIQIDAFIEWINDGAKNN